MPPNNGIRCAEHAFKEEMGTLEVTRIPGTQQ
jgi:hypothetical protein